MRISRACTLGNHSTCTAKSCRCTCHAPERQFSGACAEGDPGACRMPGCPNPAHGGKPTAPDLAAVIAAADLSPLDNEGATVDLGDGFTLTLRVESDPDSSVFDDGDWVGRLEWVHPPLGWCYTYPPPRPDDMTGAARVLDADGRSRLWWQPPAEVEADKLDEMAGTIRDLLHYGYQSVGVTLDGPATDSLGGGHTVRIAEQWIGGVGRADADYLRVLAGELAGELDFALTTVAP